MPISNPGSQQNLNILLALASIAACQRLSVPWIDWARPLILKQASSAIPHTNYIQPGSYAFANSQNALEDVLGLTSARVAIKSVD